MLRRARLWLERQKLMQESRPAPRIDRVLVSEAKGDLYEVVIEGLRLTPAISPPSITVGGLPLQQARFEPGGRRITGALYGPPKDERVALDLGYTRTEWGGTYQSGE